MTGKQIASKQDESLTPGERNGSLRQDTHINWKYMLAYGLLFLINVLPLITEKPYLPQDTQDVIINLLMVATVPYQAYGPVFHIATLLIVAGILWKPGQLGRLVAGYIGVNYLVIGLAQTMGQTEKYGFVVHLSALVTMILLGIIWLVVAFRNRIQPTLRNPTLIEYGLIALALLAYWGPYTAIDGTIRPHFSPLLLLTSPDYGLTFCFTTPVFLMGLILFHPRVDPLAYRVTAFCGLLYGLFNLTHWFNPATQWMGFLHLPLLIISLYALILPRLNKPLQQSGTSPDLKRT
jgi:hypothetical protein